MGTIVGIIIVAALVVIVAVNRALRNALPSRAAKRQLDAQIADIEGRLTAASVVDREFYARQVQQIRQQWIHEQMANTLIESLDIPGAGPSTQQTLRDHGVVTLRDLGRFGHQPMPNIGDKRRAQLLAGYRSAERQILDRAARLGEADLDAYTNGRLGEVIKNHEVDELHRRREVEDLQIRVRELQRRRNLIDV